MFELAFLLAQHGEHGHGDVSPLLDPESWGLVFWTAITFGVVLVVLKTAAGGPILKGLEQRARTISVAIETAKRDRLEAAKVLEEHKKQLASVRNEAQAILNEAAADAKRLAEETHAKAQA